MKKLYRIKIAIVSLMVAASFSSCLKDPTHEYDFASNAPVIDWALVAYKVGASTQTCTISGTSTTNQVNALVTVQSASPTTVPITATVIVDAPAVPSGGTLLPATTYTISGAGLSFTIPAGNTQPLVGNGTIPIVGALPTIIAGGQYPVTFILNGVAIKALPAGTYYLPLTISSASGQGVIIDQFHTLVYKIVVGP